MEPNGRAFLKGTHYRPPTEEPDADYPFYLTTGRLVHYFHTRTKTGRSRALRDAAPDERIRLARADAERLGVAEGDWVRITSRRGAGEARATLGDIEPGQAFVPFHFGYWDAPGRARAANELTLYEWDPISKQPHFKCAAVRIERVDAPTTEQPVRVNLHPEQAGGDPSFATAALEAVKGAAKAAAKTVTSGPPRAHLADYPGLLDESEKRLVKAFDQVRQTHPDTPDIVSECRLFAEWATKASASLQPSIARYGERREDEPERLDRALLVQRKQAGFDLLRDLHDLFLLVNESFVSVAILGQAAVALKDRDLRDRLEPIRLNNDRMREWLYARCRQAAPQTLIVPL